MIKKESASERGTVHSADEYAQSLKKQLGIKQIRDFVDSLRHLPNGSPIPDMSSLTIGDRFAIVLRLIHLNLWESLTGRSIAHLRRYEQGTEIPLTVAAAVAAEAEIPLEWIVTGRAMERTGERLSSGDCIEIAAGFSFVPRYDVRPSGGPGAVEASGDLDGGSFVAFRTDWLRRLGIDPNRAEVIFAVGDSMDPTIRDGDLILVDRSIDRVVDNGIYVVTLGGLVLVKRVQSRSDGGIILSSDNSNYRDDVVPAGELPNLKIEGRVRWFGRTI
jgi:phage repressor protein C with HTH and peptisase S24 domain